MAEVDREMAAAAAVSAAVARTLATTATTARQTGQRWEALAETIAPAQRLRRLDVVAMIRSMVTTAARIAAVAVAEQTATAAMAMRELWSSAGMIRFLRDTACPIHVTSGGHVVTTLRTDGAAFTMEGMAHTDIRAIRM